MSDEGPRYRLDLSSNSCRVRLEVAKPGKAVKVLVRDLQAPDGPLLHGTGVLADDASVFTATFPAAEGEQTLVLAWPEVRAELARHPRYD
jgi:hypothetical protein